MFCPNCSAEINGLEHSESCWNCGASFEEGSAWEPTEVPVGEFRKFASKQKKETVSVVASGPMNPFLEVVLRLFLGGMVWVVVGVLAALSALPYGGGNGVLITLVVLSPLGILAWVLFPLHRLFKPSENGRG